jgi:hypothetical protein
LDRLGRREKAAVRLSDEGAFFYIPFSGLQSMVEVFGRRIIKLLVQRGLLNEDVAHILLSRRHSGFSIDSSVRKRARARPLRGCAPRLVFLLLIFQHHESRLSHDVRPALLQV